jgi:hypothetical protein
LGTNAKMALHISVWAEEKVIYLAERLTKYISGAYYTRKLFKSQIIG